MGQEELDKSTVHVIIFVLALLLSAALLAHATALIPSLRPRRLLVISIAALINAGLWTIISYMVTGMYGYKWSVPLQCFMEFDLFAIISFIVALFAAPRPKV